MIKSTTCINTNYIKMNKAITFTVLIILAVNLIVGEVFLEGKRMCICHMGKGTCHGCADKGMKIAHVFGKRNHGNYENARDSEEFNDSDEFDHLSSEYDSSDDYEPQSEDKYLLYQILKNFNKQQKIENMMQKEHFQTPEPSSHWSKRNIDISLPSSVNQRSDKTQRYELDDW